MSLGWRSPEAAVVAPAFFRCQREQAMSLRCGLKAERPQSGAVVAADTSPGGTPRGPVLEDRRSPVSLLTRGPEPATLLDFALQNGILRDDLVWESRRVWQP
jgi:hypothetical protein